MRKIPTLFERDWDGDRSRVTPQVNPACAWVLAGEGVATRKLDGTCCMIRDGKLFKRRELQDGQFHSILDERPEGFEAVDHDEETGKTVGWVPVGDGPEDRYHREAWANLRGVMMTIDDGTYELLGPKVQGNPEGYEEHRLVAHGDNSLQGQYEEKGCLLVLIAPPPRDFEGLRAWLADKDIEGIVWHGPDGRMAKIKLRDFGLKRKKAAAHDV